MVSVPGAGHLNLTVGSVNINFMLKKTGPNTFAFRRRPTPPINAIPNPLLEFPHFGDGCGSFYHRPGRYGIARGLDARFGFVIPGPREVADMTGIAAGYRVKKVIKHGDVNMAITYNGTNTKVYREETSAWAEKEQVNSVEPFDIISFKDVVAVYYGANAYRFSSDDGGTWTASTKTGNSNGARNGKYALRQMNGLTAPRVIYVADPSQVYWTEDLTNTDAVGSVGETIDDTAGDQQAFRSIAQDDLGDVIFGMRHALFKRLSGGIYVKITKDYSDAVADAGGQGDRGNFEAWCENQGRLYYIVQGTLLGEWYQGKWRDDLGPAKAGRNIPRMQLPLNAIVSIGDYIIVAAGTTTPTTLKDVTYAPGGAALLINTFGTTSDLYAGRWQYDEETQDVRFVWHGSLLETTDPLRYLWYDEDDNYLYLASGASESINVQQVRCRWVIDEPLTHEISNIIDLATAAGLLESGRIDYGDPFSTKILRSFSAMTLGLASTTPSLRVRRRTEAEYTAAAGYQTFVTYTSNSVAETGTAFASGLTFRTCRLEFQLTGGTNTYAILESAQLRAETFPQRFAVLDWTAEAVSGVLNTTGVPSALSANQLSDAMDSWQDGNALATITLFPDGDTWDCLLEDYSIDGWGQMKEIHVVAREAVS